MGVVYIGDRTVGKTALALELIKSNSEYARVANQDRERDKYPIALSVEIEPKSNQIKDCEIRVSSLKSE